MDVSNLTNLTLLKSLAYDQIALKEQAERNLRVINDRIVQVSAQSDNAGEPGTTPPLPPEAGDESTTTTTTVVPENGSDATGEQDAGN